MTRSLLSPLPACILAILLLLNLPLAADVVLTRDGARLVGVIEKIEDGILTLETRYAGTLEVDLTEVYSFSTEDPVVLRLETGDTMSGVVEAEDDRIHIEGEEGLLTTRPERVSTLWHTTAVDPAVRARERELAALERRWNHQLSFDLAGRRGNSDEFSLGTRFTSVLEGPEDALRFYFRYRRSERDSMKTADETVGGMRYEAYPAGGDIGWYTRVELENLPFENIDLRTTVGAGATYRFIRQDHHSLSGRVGMAYRFVSFSDGTSEDEPALDLGLSHRFQRNDWWAVTTELNVTPSLEDLGEFLLSQDTGFEIPIARGFWRLRLGVTNEYNSQPPIGIRKLDTIYYTSLLLSWPQR